MIRIAIVVLMFALVAALLGFTPLGGESMYVARNMFYALLVIFIVGATFSPDSDKPTAAH